MQEDLRTSSSLVSLTVALYTFANGITALIWGPSSDYFGRKVNYLVSMAAFLAISAGCIFAPDINVLIILRALQGCAGDDLWLVLSPAD